MKKILASFVAAIVMVIVGCKSLPTPESLAVTSRAVGIAAATVANMTKIDDASRNVVVEIMNEVEGCIPQTNETFEAAWTPIAKRHVQKLVDEKKIDDGQATLILGAFDVACKGIDYLVFIRYPKAVEYTELVEAATHGFCEGFLSNFKPANRMCFGCAMDKSDKEAYEYLLTLKNLKK